MKDEYIQKFVDCVSSQDIGVVLTVDDVKKATRRQDLGISSLNIILVVVAYIESSANGGVALEPEWVPRLDHVSGILSVLEEIDEASSRAVSVT